MGRRKHFRGFSGPLAFAVLGLWRKVAVLGLLFAALVAKRLGRQPGGEKLTRPQWRQVNRETLASFKPPALAFVSFADDCNM